MIKKEECIETIETSDFQIEDLGVQEEWVYDIEVEDNHNFFANNICVHNSNYVSIAPVIQKKFGKDYLETIEREKITKFIESYINKVSLPITYEALEKYSRTLNAKMPEKLIEDPEIICDTFISIKPKMYFGRKLWEDGRVLPKPKLKVTGLSMVRVSTPKYYRQELKGVLDILIDGDVSKIAKYIDRVRESTKEQHPSAISINQGVSSLTYDWHEDTRKFKRWDGNKFLSAPVNSRASLTHNLYIENKVGLNDIEAGDKIKFVYLKVPNPTFANSSAFAFKNEKVFDDNLVQYIDYDMMFGKGFLNPIKLITDPLNWDLTPKEDLLDDDEW